MTARLPDTSIWGGNAGTNPRDPFDPWKPGYLSTAGIVMAYRSSLEDRLLALALGLGAPATPGATVPLPKARPRVPDESSAYYLKRTAEASAARPVEHQWMLGDPRIGQNQLPQDLNVDPDSPATFDERWVSDNPWQRQNPVDPNVIGRPVGPHEAPPASNRTEPSGTPLPKPRPSVDGYSPHTKAELQTLAPLAAEMWSENAEALKAQGIQIQIKQGFRTEEQNKKEKGAKDSEHLRGTAIDMSLRGLTTEQTRAVIAQFLSDPRVKGFGYYPQWGSIHVDVRSGDRYAWGQNHSWTSIGEGWPEWLTNQVREWWKGVPLPKPRPQ